MKGCRRNQLWLNLNHIPVIWLEGLRTITKKPHESLSPGWDLNLGTYEYEAGVLTTESKHSANADAELNRDAHLMSS